MIKRFNLVCGGKKIRTIEELRTNFITDEVISLYKSGKLHRWLQASQYIEELTEIKALDVLGNLEYTKLAKKLLSIFKVEEAIDKVNKEPEDQDIKIRSNDDFRYIDLEERFEKLKRNYKKIQESEKLLRTENKELKNKKQDLENRCKRLEMKIRYAERNKGR